MLRPVSAILLILFSAAAAITLRAHPAPFSYLDVHIAADGLSGRLAIHDLDAAYELKLEDPVQLADPAFVAAQAPALAAVLAQLLLRF